VGPPVFKTGDAALGAAWWVRLPCAPATTEQQRSMSTETRQRPPSVDAVISAVRRELDGSVDHAALAGAARSVVDAERDRLAGGAAPTPVEGLAAQAAEQLAAFTDVPLGTAINATGVIVHTNLGRAPWPQAVIDAAAAAAGDYLLLELDRETGRRGARFRLAEEHLIALTGAEDALVTNNNAAALALAVGLAGRGRGVAVSRGELVEIGGGVRIPEIVRRAGARLVEVGTTNRTRVTDFEDPLEDGRARLVLRVHPSNFRQEGFTEAPDAVGLATLAHEHGAIVVDDLGSGALLPTERYGLAHEPMPSERLAAGADIVTFSGDKLVGGPQAGLVVGRKDLIARLRKDPLARAMRPDKVTLAAVAATLGLYRAGLAETEVPVWRMIAAGADGLRARAAAVAAILGDGADVIATEATVGGGSLPGDTLPSFGIAVSRGRANAVLDALRRGRPSVVGRIDAGRVVLDLRTVEADRDGELAAAVRAATA
jgi:L-seryl-tRNA(Ser) seleniumtransferase